MNFSEKYFLYVGNAYPHKNLERLLEAFQHVTSHISPVTLILVGQEDYFYKRLKEKVNEMGLKNEVIFYGPAATEELNNLYKNALALVFPSLMEGFGLPGVEAMANSCLVLCSDIPVFHEVLGEAGIYFGPENTAEMANKVKMVFNNPEQYESLKTKGKDWVKHYSWQKLAKQTLEVYQETL